MAGDNSLIGFKEFFELMKDKTRNNDGAGGIDFEHNEKNVSCFLFPIFGNWLNSKAEHKLIPYVWPLTDYYLTITWTNIYSVKLLQSLLIKIKLIKME